MVTHDPNLQAIISSRKIKWHSKAKEKFTQAQIG
jgi:hypothetical protein